ncbi:hypothetical protein PUMCH_004107 [Australozyma saopauloensis]|uniref:AAA+ ATPase domain-containing protein n=1 Tax=Australozyma saopauloensis TaxID=291208 RepID=A0AAX4HEF0_9ASCO|nr:hypothetical protein PUMCH_004107 [[Candida] saopauloensis]
METEFSLHQSILFAEPAIEKPLEPVKVPLLKNPATVPSTKPKKVALFNGSVISLKPRVRPTGIGLDEKGDSFFSMDDLYERVRLRDELRQSRKVIDEAKKRDAARLAEAAKETAEENRLLWSDKYRPSSFLEICPAGNERQYRLVMHWLSKWGSLVFGNAKIDDENVDHLGRPLRKILLVHGPSGVGKTAVVHLLARQMGYHVEELNAANSMDTLGGTDADTGRGANIAAVLKLRVKNALTTNTITAQGKPTCLVIDEIDSASNTAEIVRVLADVLRSDSDNRTATESSSGTFFLLATKKKPKKKFSLNRPIICIANDIYSNSGRSGSANPMEKLRQFCEIVPFRKATGGESMFGKKINASAQKTVKAHLADISKKEKLNLDHREISEVFEICEGDIRASINYLQFSSRKLDPELVGRLATSDNSSNKDKTMSWFLLVDRLFTRDQKLSKEENFESVMRLVSSGDEKTAASGSLDKVIRGCFNKYLDVVHLQDDLALRPAMISDWLFYYDALTTGARDASFYPTLASLKFWSLFSDINPQKFRDTNSLVPNARGLEFESFELLKKNKAVVQRIVDQLPIETKLSFGGTSSNFEFYACQFIPILDRMFSPEIGSSRAMSALQPFEQALLKKLVLLTETLDLQLETQRDTELNMTYLLFAPDWDTIASFPSEEKYQQKRKLTNAKRQWLFPLLQQELDAKNASAQLKRKRTETPDAEEKGAKTKKQKLTSSIEYFRSQYGDVAAKTEAPVSRDDSSRIWVKYHEGFSNAVRKNIGWKDLWS